MQIELTIADIVQKLREGRFPNEQSISQGIVLRILSDLGWDVYDTNIVWPEFSTGEGRVDFALCDPRAKPRCFVEVKQPGKAEDGVKQALEYAFHTGAQFVTLTDGQTWSFYLPAEQGSYEDRRVFKLDLFERTEQKSAEILRRYLKRGRVASGEALNTARKEYRDRNRQSAARQAISGAWNELVERADELLVELLTDAVESKAGIRPDEKDILSFFARLVPAQALSSSGVHSARNLLGEARVSDHYAARQTVSRPLGSASLSTATKRPSGGVTGRVWDIADEISARVHRPALREEVLSAAIKEEINQNTASTQYGRWAKFKGLTRAELVKIRAAEKSREPSGKPSSGFVRTNSGVLHGKEFSYATAKEAMVFILGELAKADPTFLHRCSQHPAFRGRTRRYVAQRAADLYPGRPDMTSKHDALPGGWVVGTHLDNRSKMRIIKGAAEVAGIAFGHDVQVQL